MKTIYVLDFTEYPGLRHCSISDDSGELYYHSILNREFKSCLENNELLLVNLDNTAGYAPSFLDEAFGNLIYDFSKKIVEENLRIITEQEPEWDEFLINETYTLWEERRIEKSKPKKTVKHKPWFAMISGKIVEVK